MQLARGGHVDAHAFLVGEASHGLAQERLRCVGDPLAEGCDRRASARPDVVLVVNEQRRAEFARQVACVQTRDQEPSGGVDRRVRRQKVSGKRRHTCEISDPMPASVSPFTVVDARLAAAIDSAFGSDFENEDAVLRPSQHADAQANAAMALAKRVGKAPREVATAIIEAAELDDVCERVEIAGPGFINLWLRPETLAAAVGALAGDERCRRGAGRQSRTRGDRLLEPDGDQGDARRPPAHDDHRRRPRAHPRVPRPHRHTSEPLRRLGHLVRHAHRAHGGPARRERADRPRRPQRVLQGGQRTLLDPTRTSARGRAPVSSRCSRAMPTRWKCGGGSSTRRTATTSPSTHASACCSSTRT